MTLPPVNSKIRHYNFIAAKPPKAPSSQGVTRSIQKILHSDFMDQKEEEFKIPTSVDSSIQEILINNNQLKKSLKSMIKSMNIMPKEEMKEGQYGFLSSVTRQAQDHNQFSSILKDRLATAPISISNTSLDSDERMATETESEREDRNKFRFASKSEHFDYKDIKIQEPKVNYDKVKKKRFTLVADRAFIPPTEHTLEIQDPSSNRHKAHIPKIERERARMINQIKKQQKISQNLMKGKRRKKIPYYSFEQNHKKRYTPISTKINERYATAGPNVGSESPTSIQGGLKNTLGQPIESMQANLTGKEKRIVDYIIKKKYPVYGFMHFNFETEQPTEEIMIDDEAAKIAKRYKNKKNVTDVNKQKVYVDENEFKNMMKRNKQNTLKMETLKILKQGLLRLSIRHFNSLLAQRVVNKIKKTFTYTAIKAYKKLKEKRQAMKRLNEKNFSSALASLVIQEKQKRDKQKEEEASKPKIDASTVMNILKSGIIGRIKRTVTKKKVNPGSRFAKKKTLAKKKEAERRSSQSLAYIAGQNNIVNGIMIGKFSKSSLEPKKQTEEIAPPPSNMLIKAYDNENQKRYTEFKNQINIMYDPFYVVDKTEKTEKSSLGVKTSSKKLNAKRSIRIMRKKKTKAGKFSLNSKSTILSKEIKERRKKLQRT
ncbi:unnamed protein product [Moneuplotes crassus]|uniref:Uncharacterized protein n=1 Tax=Euplotes crassus TaxID=5936 RepID=A0AAD1Y8E8_EUPCR|nr:unnamed protein product [Moneuplotes crassus]